MIGFSGTMRIDSGGGGGGGGNRWGTGRGGQISGSNWAERSRGGGGSSKFGRNAGGVGITQPRQRDGLGTTSALGSSKLSASHAPR